MTGAGPVWSRCSQLARNSKVTIALPTPCIAPMRLARVPGEMRIQSIRPNGAASNAPISPKVISQKATVAMKELPEMTWTRSTTTAVASRPSGNTTSIWWTGWPRKVRERCMETPLRWAEASGMPEGPGVAA